VNILGINYFFHDTSACLLSDGQLLTAHEEERFSRVKHTWEFPVLAIHRCFADTGLEPNDIDYIAVSIKPSLNWVDKVRHGLAKPSRIPPFAKQEIWHGVNRQRSLKQWYRATWPQSASRPEIVFVPHHLTHAMGSFLVSPYDSAAVLSIDGSGEWATSLLGWGKGRQMDVLTESFFPDSLGSFYEAATQFCGFRPNYDEGKTMGLAPYGDSTRFYDDVASLVSVGPAGRIRMDRDHFSFADGGHQRFSPRFVERFGKPRHRDEPLETRHIDVAAAFQRVLEEKALDLCRILHERTGERHLVLSGGVALNSVMNGRIVRESPFEDIYVMPGAGDNGTCIGAAFHVWHSRLGRERTYVHDDPYLGSAYDDEAIKTVLDRAKLNYVRSADIAADTARHIAAGQIVGWFQGRMEFGPRALGGRSILADPTRANMKDKINAEVKHREAFRPFAPSVAEEDRDRFFDLPVNAPFMLKVCDVRAENRCRLPAITHVDGSARLQTVSSRTNPLYHRLLKNVEQLRGIPVVLNTSFNVMGEPIVESPLDAVRCFYSTGIDVLAIGNFVVTKSDPGRG